MSIPLCEKCNKEPQWHPKGWEFCLCKECLTEEQHRLDNLLHAMTEILGGNITCLHPEQEEEYQKWRKPE